MDIVIIGSGKLGSGLAKSLSEEYFSIFSKVVLCIDMLAGRLEIFPILILFNPATYKK